MAGFMTLLDICLAAVAISIIQRMLSKKSSHPLPPGPAPLPLLGNLLDLPTEQEWKTFGKWGQKYGDLVSVNVFGQTLIIVNSPQVATEMLDKKSSNYSERPILPMGGELCGWKDTLVLLPYGQRLRNFRKYFHQLIGTPQNLKPFVPNFEKQTRTLLRNLLAKPDEFQEHVRAYSGSIILKMAYGWNVQGSDDPFVRIADTAVSNFSASTKPGGFLVDVMPVLKHVPDWVPGAGFKKVAKQYKAELMEMIDQPFIWLKKQIAAGTAEKSFTSNLLEDCDSAEQEDEIRWCSGSLYGAGADTTVAQNNAIFKALAMHPEVLKAAQEEIDRVIGNDRLPLYSDRPNLPYVDALVTENLRWHSTAPTGVAHRVKEDDIFNGYFIPKDSLVITNVSGMANNPTVYPNPEIFDPTRHIATADKPAQADPREFCYGFGRRICPGKTLADHQMFVAIAAIVSVFDIEPFVENGVKDVLAREQLSGTISHQVPYRCVIKPRSRKAAELIQQEEAF